MGKKDKKKGKGAEKTAAKTEKKALQKAKKELAAKGEDDIEQLIAEFQEKDKKTAFVGIERCSPPSQRSGLTICPHPEKDELVMFGGEYFNGVKTEMYNDVYFYNTKKDHWSVLQCSVKPPPRCSHQAVVLSQAGGQMWVFGGEFASPTRSNFYHYKDLWVFHFAERKWEQVKASGGPSARSGHRMVASRKWLIVFGGFHESLRDYKYFNDVHIFDLEKYQWTKIEPSGHGPCPRSACQMASLSDGRVMLYGGYSRTKVKKDVDKGTTHTDMYLLQLDEKSGTPKWKWISIKQTGIQPLPRSGFSMAVASNNRTFFFGGVHDEEDSEEELKSIFHNDLFALEMESGRWIPIVLHGKTENTEKKRRRKAKEGIAQAENKESDTELDEHDVENLSISESVNDSAMEEVQTIEDSVFTVKIGPSLSSQAAEGTTCMSNTAASSAHLFTPHPRMNAAVVVKHGTFYLYGGLYEDGDKQLTLSDFYSLDLHKLDEWKTIIASNIDELEWCESEPSTDNESDDEENEESDMEVGSDNVRPEELG